MTIGIGSPIQKPMDKPFFSIFLADEGQTLAFAARLGEQALAGDFLALHGPLGSGKTTFARGYIQAFCGAALDVPSPTFTLVQIYSSGKLTQPALDFSILIFIGSKNAEEVWELGWEDITAGVALVEWADHGGPYLPANRLELRLIPHDNGRWLQSECARE
ncbi:MAG: tRNA (adenosine(37)-N6)-threonylcarbamoyltransferase complex ATPase subunit type 1 TsaE [Hyphomonadaceae bacterium]|nr:tRNA (adenosine(37)-N6)-threonylcarbamoyltransferase complex ATPase subunit type 1 TsaE [Hyphomonadaceae bacterium]